MTYGQKWFLRYLLVPLTAFLLGAFTMLWVLIRTGNLEEARQVSTEKKRAFKGKYGGGDELQSSDID